MEINRKEEGGIVFVTIKGRLDADNALEAEKTVNNALEGDATESFSIWVLSTISAVLVYGFFWASQRR